MRKRRLVAPEHPVAGIFVHIAGKKKCTRLCMVNGAFFQEHAFESSQKYKEGKYIIEMAHMIKENGWESPPKK